jgi:YVTN family beta-propeller protein
MRFTRRTAILISVAITGLATVATATAAAASASSAQSTVRAVTSCIKVTATIRLGRGLRPIGAATDPTTNTIYVTNFGNDTVSVISGRTNTVTATIRVGRLPVGVAANPKTNTSYVVNDEDSTVSVLASCRR